jgi:hypothetical protein
MIASPRIAFSAPASRRAPGTLPAKIGIVVLIAVVFALWCVRAIS